MQIYPMLLSGICAFLLAIIVMALIFSPSFRVEILGSQGDASIFGLITVKGAAVVLLCALFLGGMMYPLKSNESNLKISPISGKINNGETCSADDECDSGYCWPAPSAKPTTIPPGICIARDRQCALPKLDGASYGSTVFHLGSRLVCGKPDTGGRGQFVSPTHIKN